MIEKMTRYEFILLSSNKDEFISSLGELGVMDINRSSKPMDERSWWMYSRLEVLTNMMGDLRKDKNHEMEVLLAEKERLQRERAELEHWGDYDREKLQAVGLPVRFYCMPEKKFKPEWEDECVLQVADRANGKVWFVTVGDFEIPATPLPEPAASISETDAMLVESEAKIAEQKARFEQKKSELPALEAEAESIRKELELYLAGKAGEEAAEGIITVYEGFAPSSEDARLKEALDAMDCVWFASEAKIEDNPPIKLKNNKFVKQFEPLTDMYGRPDYNEFDPTPYISVFFLLFFAMCMGDAGYGLILFIGGFLLKKVPSMKNLAPLVSILGAATFVVGIMMHTFFGYDIATLPWIPGWLKSIMITGTIGGFEAQMVLALAIGVVHLCLAMVVKTVYATKNKGFLESLSVWGWTLLIVGGVIVGALALLKLVPPEVTKWIIICLGIISALGIFLLNDIHRNPLKNIGSGLWETYNTATGLLGDVLSYLRLYALGLAGGMLGKAFNDIASMTLGDGGFSLGWIAFPVILIIGHALNFAMCCLGAFVHPLRLNFLEFFKNAGYDGKGRTYKALEK
ncbi:MAG: ATPase V [Bacteroidales bacterium]|nr:ATPase V [Bacteroidales bacterium]